MAKNTINIKFHLRNSFWIIVIDCPCFNIDVAYEDGTRKLQDSQISQIQEITLKMRRSFKKHTGAIRVVRADKGEIVNVRIIVEVVRPSADEIVIPIETHVIAPVVTKCVIVKGACLVIVPGLDIIINEVVEIDVIWQVRKTIESFGTAPVTVMDKGRAT